MLRYLSTDIICSEKRTVFRERTSRKTVSYEEQAMSKDKYPSIFSRQIRSYYVHCPSSRFRNRRRFSENWKISLGYSLVLAGAYSAYDTFRRIE